MTRAYQYCLCKENIILYRKKGLADDNVRAHTIIIILVRYVIVYEHPFPVLSSNIIIIIFFFFSLVVCNCYLIKIFNYFYAYNIYYYIFDCANFGPTNLYSSI